MSNTAPSEIYTLSLHDALPIYRAPKSRWPRSQRFALSAKGVEAEAAYRASVAAVTGVGGRAGFDADRKSTRLNSSHGYISYAVFCLKKKKKQLSVDLLLETYLT